MKHLKVAGLCLVSMFVMSTALASNASAAPLWLLCLPFVNNPTRYDSNQCNKASGTGSWESVSIESKSDTVRILAFSLKLADTGTGTEVECPDPGTEGWGLIENTNKGLIKVAKVKEPKVNCKLLKAAALGCLTTNNLEEIEGVNLPWKTEIFETEFKKLTDIKNSGAGAPGWKVRCGGITDTCTEKVGEPEGIELSNEVTGGVLLVRGIFESKRKAHCSFTNTNTGTVAGLVAILLWNGNGLSINNA
jgi:hypothetical protein